MMPEISIIIPSFNSEKYISFALDSVVNQSLLSAEILIIDNCSSDKTIQIARSYKKKLNIKIISEPDNGVNFAFRKGLALAKGKYVCALPSTDGYFDPNYLNAALSEFKGNTSLNAVLAAGAFEIDEDGSPLYQLHPWKNYFFKFFSKTHHKHLASSLGLLLPDMGFVIERKLLYKIFPKEKTPLYGSSVSFLGVLKNIYSSDINFIVLPKVASYGRHHSGKWTHQINDDNNKALRDFRLSTFYRFFSVKNKINLFFFRIYAFFIYCVLMIFCGALGYYIERIYMRIKLSKHF